MDNEGLHVDHSVRYANNASHFRRAAFEGVGGYPSESLGADAALDAAFSGLAHAVEPLRGDKEPTRGERFYVYRWAVSPVHKSGSGVEDFYREVQGDRWGNYWLKGRHSIFVLGQRVTPKGLGRPFRAGPP